MAPKKTQAQKMSLGDFLGDQSLGSWADEMEDMPVGSGTGGGGYGSGERRTFGSGGGGGGFGSDRGYARTDNPNYAARETLPLPTKPPYTAHLGNLPFDVTEGDIQDFFHECEVTNVRIVEDRFERKPKGFGYVEYGSLDGLKKALELSGTQFQGRNIRISVAEPPKERSEAREITDWTRKGPLPDIPSAQRRPSERGGYRQFDNASDAGGERGERRRPPPFEGDGKSRDFGNWERKGPLSPVPGAAPPMREGGRLRSHEGPRERRQSPAWGEGRSQDGSRPPRREFQERPVVERQPTAAELDNQWRSKMRPDAAVKSPTSTPDTSVPSSPAPQAAAPATRPRLNLAKRTVSEAEPTAAASTSDSKPNPFGAARPIDTAAREKEVEEKRQLAIRQKKEADEKAREERKAKEAAEKAAAKDKPAPASPSVSSPKEGKESGADEKTEKPAGSNYEILRRVSDNGDATAKDAPANGDIVDDKAVKPKEVTRDPPSKGEGSWRQKPSAPTAPKGTATQELEEDGWSTVTKPQKNARRGGRAVAS